MLGILPKCYSLPKLNIAPEAQLNIDPILTWLHTNSVQYKWFSRRYPILLKWWVDYLTMEQKDRHILILLEYLGNADAPTRFGTIDALRMLVTSDSKWSLDLSNLIVKTFPVVCGMMSTLTSPTLIWPISAFMTKLLQKAQCEMTPEIVGALRGMDMDHLLASNNLVIRSCVIEMLKTVVVTKPFGEPMTWLYEICLKYLTIVFPRMELEETQEIKFWKFIVKEIPNVPENQGVLGALYNFLVNSRIKLNLLNNYDQIPVAMCLMEEYYLLFTDNFPEK